MKMAKRRMANKLALMCALALVGAVTVHTTYAMLHDTTEQKQNVFRPGLVNIHIDETFEDKNLPEGDRNQNKEVRIQNSSEKGQLNIVPIYIRARIVAQWKDDAGNLLPVNTDSIQLNWEKGEEPGGEKEGCSIAPGRWEKGDDGYYYYTGVVAPDQYTGYLIHGAGITEKELAPEGGHLELEVLAEGIQSEGEAMWDAWKK